MLSCLLNLLSMQIPMQFRLDAVVSDWTMEISGKGYWAMSMAWKMDWPFLPRILRPPFPKHFQSDA